MPIDFAYRHRLSVRFRDCDAMGHVNHAVYFTYLEQCRLTYWRELTGTPSPHTRVIIARAECDYRAPAHFGDELEVRVNIEAIGRSSFTLVYEIVKVGGGQLIARRQDRHGQLRLRRREVGAAAGRDAGLAGGRASRRVRPGSDPGLTPNPSELLTDSSRRCVNGMSQIALYAAWRWALSAPSASKTGWLVSQSEW